VENQIMKCVNCGGSMKTERRAHRYTESGLSNVTLLNVEVRTCPACGEQEIVIPHIEDLHRLIARAVMVKPSTLSPDEIRFLRKWLGFSSTDFALAMGVRPETVSRWESKSTRQPMAATAERLLRLMVANQEPVEKYPIDLFKTQPRVKPAPLKFRAPDWKRSVG
jgi:putative zinc finger/helix-turn-helix YgiT family protein